MKIKLFNHQQSLVDKNPSKYGLWHDTGTGKSVTSISLALKKGFPTLILCPKFLRDNWVRELSRFNLEYKLMSKEEFRKDWDNIEKFNTLIIDECHFFLGKSLMNRALSGGKLKRKNYLGYIPKHNPENIFLLSATPYNLTEPLRLFRINKIFGRGWNRQTFMGKFYRSPNRQELHYIKNPFAQIPKDDIKEEIIFYLKKMGEFVHIRECVDIKEPIFEVEYFNLNAEQKIVLKSQADILPIQKFTFEHRVCGGTIHDEYNGDKFINCEKIQRVKQITQLEDKLFIVCKYNLEIDFIKATIGRDDVLIINGSTKNPQWVVDKANSSKRCVLLVNAACSTGHNLPSFNKIIFYSHGWSGTDNKQMCGRICRIDNPQQGVYVSLICKGTVDEAVYHNVIIKKRSFQASMYDGG